MKKFIEEHNYIFTALIPIITLLITIPSIITSLVSLNISKNQLKISELQYKPDFEIAILKEPVDNIYETYVQIENNGYGVDTKININTIMLVEWIENSNSDVFKIELKGFIENEKNVIGYSNPKSGIIKKRGTNFADYNLDSKMYQARINLNNNFESKKIQMYDQNIYCVQISFIGHDGKEQTVYYVVGQYINKKITSKEYKELLKCDYILDVGNYLNEDIFDDLMDIILKEYSSQ